MLRYTKGDLHNLQHCENMVNAIDSLLSARLEKLKAQLAVRDAEEKELRALLHVSDVLTNVSTTCNGMHRLECDFVRHAESVEEWRIQVRR